MPRPWTPDPDWRGRTAVVIGTGPSLALEQVRAVALARLADRVRVIAVNDAALVAPFADIAFAADPKWWTARANLPRFAGLRVGLDAGKFGDHPEPEDFHVVTRAGCEGYALEGGRVCTQGNSGAMAVQMAAQTAAEKIVLVGFDARARGDLRHFFGEYDRRDLQGAPDMGKWIEFFAPLAAALAGRLFNATPGSALAVPPIDLAAAF